VQFRPSMLGQWSQQQQHSAQPLQLSVMQHLMWLGCSSSDGVWVADIVVDDTS